MAETIDDPRLVQFLQVRSTSGTILAHQIETVVSEAVNRFDGMSEEDVLGAIKRNGLDPATKAKSVALAADKGFVPPPSPPPKPKPKPTPPAAIKSEIPPLADISPEEEEDREEFEAEFLEKDGEGDTNQLPKPKPGLREGQKPSQQRKGGKDKMKLVNLKEKGLKQVFIDRLEICREFMDDDLRFQKGKQTEALKKLEKAGIGCSGQSIGNIRDIYLDRIGVSHLSQIDPASFNGTAGRKVNQSGKGESRKRKVSASSPVPIAHDSGDDFLADKIRAVEEKIGELEKVKELLVAAQESMANLGL